MSTEIQLKRLSVTEMKACPVMQLWAMSELNDLPFLTGTTVSDCWIHQKLAAYLFGKGSLKTARNTVLSGVRRHPMDQDLVLYGDLHRERVAVSSD